jgi:hypothetical protein
MLRPAVGGRLLLLFLLLAKRISVILASSCPYSTTKCPCYPGRIYLWEISSDPFIQFARVMNFYFFFHKFEISMDRKIENGGG